MSSRDYVDDGSDDDNGDGEEGEVSSGEGKGPERVIARNRPSARTNRCKNTKR